MPKYFLCARDVVLEQSFNMEQYPTDVANGIEDAVRAFGGAHSHLPSRAAINPSAEIRRQLASQFPAFHFTLTEGPTEELTSSSIGGPYMRFSIVNTSSSFSDPGPLRVFTAAKDQNTALATRDHEKDALLRELSAVRANLNATRVREEAALAEVAEQKMEVKLLNRQIEGERQLAQLLVAKVAQTANPSAMGGGDDDDGRQKRNRSPG
jgi:hypothetical protein